MATTWKDRMWHLFLVCVLGVVVSVCSSNSSKEDGGTTYSPVATAYADFKPSDVTAVMSCLNKTSSSGVNYFYSCDASDTTSLSTVTIGDFTKSNGISLGDLVSAGWRPCASDTTFCK